MLENFFKRLVNSLFSIIDKIKCSMSCCSNTISIRVLEPRRMPPTPSGEQVHDKLL